jgi:hypothetical protein
MTDLATLQTRLTEAESQLHKLVTGTSVVEVWRDGRRIIYSKADIEALRSYISDLKAEIAAQTGETMADTRLNRRFYGPRFF